MTPPAAPSPSILGCEAWRQYAERFGRSHLQNGDAARACQPECLDACVPEPRDPEYDPVVENVLCTKPQRLHAWRTEEQIREAGERNLKEAMRAEYDIGWLVKYIPSNVPRASMALGESPKEGMFCIALARDAAKQTSTLQVLPTSEPSASVLLEYLSIALRVRLTEGTEPLFSLDPIPRVDTDAQSGMQVKRFEPHWLAGTSAGEVMFQADYHMKELCMGAALQPIAGMKSCLELMLQDNSGVQYPEDWTARAWFTIKSAEVFVSDDDALIPTVRMGVEARQTVEHEGRIEDIVVTAADHPLVRYAETFTANFDLIAERRSAFFHLRELAKACVLAKHIVESETRFDVMWLKSAEEPMTVYCMEVPQLWNEHFRKAVAEEEDTTSPASPLTKLSLYGGVSLGMESYPIGPPSFSDRFAIAAPRAIRSGMAPQRPPPALAVAALDVLGEAVEDPLAPPSVSRPKPLTSLRRPGAPMAVVSSFAQRKRMQAPSLPVAAALTTRPVSVLTRLQGLTALEPPATSVMRPKGVDMDLSGQDVSKPGRIAMSGVGIKPSEAPDAGGAADLACTFWEVLDSTDAGSLAPGPSPFQYDLSADDLILLRHIFCSRLCDRRAERDRFIPPATRYAYVERLRRQVHNELMACENQKA